MRELPGSGCIAVLIGLIVLSFVSLIVAALVATSG